MTFFKSKIFWILCFVTALLLYLSGIAVCSSSLLSLFCDGKNCVVEHRFYRRANATDVKRYGVPEGRLLFSRSKAVYFCSNYLIRFMSYSDFDAKYDSALKSFDTEYMKPISLKKEVEVGSLYLNIHSMACSGQSIQTINEYIKKHSRTYYTFEHLFYGLI
jgi:hypothetical protein